LRKLDIVLRRDNSRECTTDPQTLTEQLKELNHSRCRPFITKELRDEICLTLEDITTKPDVVINRITPALLKWCREQYGL